MNDHMTQAKYQACDFFVTRIPLLPINNYYSVLSKSDATNLRNNLSVIFDSKPLNEALEVASKDLSNAVTRDLAIDNVKKNDHLLSSLLKYYIRATTRPTPFGLFSGVSIGTFQEKSDMLVAPVDAHNKRARPDMRWVYNLIKQLESDSNIRESLRYRFNDSIYVSGDRLERLNGAMFQDGADENELYTTIKYTGAVKAVEKLASTWISYKQLKESMLVTYPEVPESYIETFLSQLLSTEFLLSELRPPLMNTDILQYMISVLRLVEKNEAVDRYIFELQAIDHAIQDYNSSSVGSEIAKYYLALDNMQRLCKASHYLQVDMKIAMKRNTLSFDAKAEIERFVYAVQRMTPSHAVSDGLNQYKEQFIENYGMNAEVPVLELLDPDQGLGAPLHYLGTALQRKPLRPRSKTGKELRLEKMIERKVFSAIKNQQHSFSIDEDDIDYVSGKESDRSQTHVLDYQPSFELFLLAHPESSKSNCYFTVAPAISSSMFGKAFGRFRDLFSSIESKAYDNQFVEQKNLLSDYLIAEISEFPSTSRVGNVSSNVNGFDYQIVINTSPCDGKNVISISDLCIGIDSTSKQFYIRSKSLNRRILVQMSSMLNPLYCSTAARFLREISSVYRYDLVKCLSSLVHTKYDYCPRITYGKVIIKPETWAVSKSILGISTAESFSKCFIAFKDKWDLPKYVFLNQQDQRLLLDTENELHIQEIWNAIKHGNSGTTLSELTCDISEHAVKDPSGNTYVTEVVVPITLSKTASVSETNKLIQTKSDTNKNCMSFDRKDLTVLPGQDNWLYFKLYGCSKRVNELISTLSDNLEQMVSKSIAEKYFYIRYADPDTHIRVRIQAIPTELPNVFISMTSLLSNLQKDGFISKYTIDTYQREIERYGGPSLIQDAEKYFYHDSRMAMRIIQKVRFEKSEINLDYIGCSYIMMVLKAFGLSLEEIGQHLDSRVDRQAYRKDFQKDRKMLFAAVNCDSTWNELSSLGTYSEIYIELTQLAAELTRYATAIYSADDNGLLTNSILDIATSIIHMFCNRLVGNNEWERKIYALTRHSVYGLQGFIKHRNANSVE